MKINDYFSPASLEDALSLLTEQSGTAKIVAGGTDVMVQARRGICKDVSLVDITGIEELHGISLDREGNLHIGACTSHTEIMESSFVQGHSPVVAEAVSKIGSVQIRNMGTLGGNIASASPSADSSPALLALEACVVVEVMSGSRKIPISGFFSGPNKTVLSQTEIIREIVIPSAKGAGTAFHKHSRRVVMDLPTVNCSVKVFVDPKTGMILDATVAMGAVAPTPVVLVEVSESLKGSRCEDSLFSVLNKKAMDKVAPRRGSMRASQEYRTDMIGVVLKETIKKAYKRALNSK